MPTIKDVASTAGVSPMTVSRVLNNASNVSPSTRRKVTAAIDALGYVPSGVAKSLRSKRTQTLALLVPDNANAFWTSVARGVEDTAQNRGYSVLLCNTDENLRKQQRYLDVTVGQQVDGVIIAPCSSQAGELEILRQRRIPTVLLDRYIKGWDIDTVIGDSIAGARALVRHLISAGHRRIAVISGPPTTSTASNRIVGYRIALEEAGIPFDSRLVKEGEYRALSGERLTHVLLDEGMEPTAIFAANNTLMIGAMHALGKRGLTVPGDVALVTFGELPNTSWFFPFFTLADFPSYELGVNAAQLLFSRLDSEVALRPRHVVLPARLVIRHSCGTNLPGDQDSCLSLSLPISGTREVQTLVKPLSSTEVRRFSSLLADVPAEILQTDGEPSSLRKPDVDRLLTVLHHREADHVPLLEYSIDNRDLYEYVLEREPETGASAAGGMPGDDILPKDRVELARRLGIDAVVCSLSVPPDRRGPSPAPKLGAWNDLEDLTPATPLADQLGELEKYVRAARGTGVGVVVGIPSCFGNGVRAAGADDPASLLSRLPLLEAGLELLLEYWEQVLRAVCGRFTADIAFVVLQDDLELVNGVPALFRDLYPTVVKRLISTAKDYGKLVGLHSLGNVKAHLDVISSAGFDIVHLPETDLPELDDAKRKWAGTLALLGGPSTALLEHGSRPEIEAAVKDYCLHLGPGGGFALCSSTGITQAVPPKNVVAMIRALHKYGRYGCLGQDSLVTSCTETSAEETAQHESIFA